MLLKKKLTSIFYADFRALAVVRIGFAILLLLDLYSRAKWLPAFYTDAGLLPRNASLGAVSETAQAAFFIPIHFLFGSLTGQVFLFSIAACFAAMLLTGYKTKLATIASWILLASLHARNSFVLQGGDELLRLAIFWGMFVPWGAKWSVDSLRALVASSRFVNPDTKNFGVGIKGAAGRIFLAAFLLQPVLMYIFTVLLKTGPMWKDGTAVYYALASDHLTTSLGYALLGITAMLPLLTYGVFWLEAAAPVLLFSPVAVNFFRVTGVFLLIMMHIGMALTMGLGLFPYIVIVYLIAFLPSVVWDRVEKNTVFIFLTDIIKRAAIFFMETAFSITTSEQNAKGYFHILRAQWLYTEKIRKPDAFQYIYGWIFFPFYFCKMAAGKSITLLKNLLGFLPPFPVKFYLTDRAKGIICVFAAVFLLWYVIVDNLYGMEHFPVVVPRQVAWVGALLHINQRWEMFAPQPPGNSGWFVVPATLANGRQIDLFNGGGHVSFSKPSYIFKTYPSQPWRKYMSWLLAPEFANLRLYYADYLCQQWNSDNLAEQHVKELELIFMYQKVPPPGSGERSIAEPRSLLKHICGRP